MIGCTSPDHSLRHELTDQEVYAVINNLYADYLDSLKRPREIYYRKAIFEDSAIAKSQIENLEGNLKFVMPPAEPEINPYPITFNSEFDSWDQSRLSTFRLIDEQQSDLLIKKRLVRKNWHNDSCIFYAITRPYRPSSSMRIVMQEYKVNAAPGCIPTRNRSNILFAKGKNGWYLEHFYFD